MSQKNILLSSAGRRVGLAKIIKKELLAYKLQVKLVGIDMNPEWSPACHVCDLSFKVPALCDAGYIEHVIQLCRDNDIGTIIPTIDTELLLYSRHKELFADAGVDIVLSDESTLAIFRDKYKTHEFFKANSIPTPNTFILKEAPDTVFMNLGNYIAKPIDGSCSQGLMLSLTNSCLQELDSGSYILQEKVIGQEYTVNCFSYRGELISATPHKRVLVRSGEVCFAETIKFDEIDCIARKIVSSVQGLTGPFCFQAIVPNDGSSLKLIELNPRFGGGYPIADEAGSTMVRWLIEEAYSIAHTHTSSWQNNLRMLRYDDAIFV